MKGLLSRKENPLRKVGIVRLLEADRRRRTMPRKDHHLIRKGEEFLPNPAEKKRTIPPRQVPPPDSAPEQNIPTNELPGLGK